MNNLATAQDFQDCVSGIHGLQWQIRADAFMEAAQDWPGEAFWAGWRERRDLAASPGEET